MNSDKNALTESVSMAHLSFDEEGLLGVNGINTISFTLDEANPEYIDNLLNALPSQYHYIVNQLKKSLLDPLDGTFNTAFNDLISDSITPHEPISVVFIYRIKRDESTPISDFKSFFMQALKMITPSADLILVNAIPMVSDNEIDPNRSDVEDFVTYLHQESFTSLSMIQPVFGLSTSRADEVEVAEPDLSLIDSEVSTLLLNMLQKIAYNFFISPSLKDRDNELLVKRVNTYASITNPPAYRLHRNNESSIDYKTLMDNADQFLLPVLFD